jgi:pyruvate kinase
VVSHRIEFSKDPEKTIQNAFTTLKKREGFQTGDRVVVISDIIAGSGIDAIQIRSIN